jgi:hypothetical protein
MSLEFAREVLKVVVAQISQGFGFQVIEATALETLAEVLENCTTCCSVRIVDCYGVDAILLSPRVVAFAQFLIAPPCHKSLPL